MGHIAGKELKLNADGSPVYEVNQSGENVLDTDGNPIPVLVDTQGSVEIKSILEYSPAPDLYGKFEDIKIEVTTSDGDVSKTVSFPPGNGKITLNIKSVADAPTLKADGNAIDPTANGYTAPTIPIKTGSGADFNEDENVDLSGVFKCNYRWW